MPFAISSTVVDIRTGPPRRADRGQSPCPRAPAAGLCPPWDQATDWFRGRASTRRAMSLCRMDGPTGAAGRSRRPSSGHPLPIVSTAPLCVLGQGGELAAPPLLLVRVGPAGLGGRLALEGPPGVEPLGCQRACVDGGEHGASRLVAVAAVVEPAPGDHLDH